MAKRLVRLGAAGVAAGGLLLAAMTSPAGADVVAGGVSEGSVETSADTTGVAGQQRATDYWTPERMRAAEPLDQEVSADAASTRSPSVGTPRTIQPSAPSDDATPQAFPETGAPWDGGGEVTQNVGRVFFTYQGGDSACSATVVTAENKSTIYTAGHCVYLDGAWHENWVFVPGYDNGSAPFGEWPAEELFAHADWVESEDMNVDLGAARVAEVGGDAVEDVVGGQGIAFNQDRRFDAYSFGYPAQSPYDGSQLIYSSGPTQDDTFGGTTAIGIGSDQTGGTSGGPWFTDFDEETGAGMVNSVNSFGYIFQPGVLYGPYFGDEAETVYDTAQTS